MSGDAPSRELLEATHEFPGPYTVKAFGPHEQGFVDGVTGAASEIHSGDGEPTFSARASSKGNHVCVTVTLRVTSADDIFAFYAAIRAVPGLRMLL